MLFIKKLILSMKNLFLLASSDPLQFIVVYYLQLFFWILAIIAVLFNTRNQNIYKRLFILLKAILFLVCAKIVVFLAEHLNS